MLCANVTFFPPVGWDFLFFWYLWGSSIQNIKIDNFLSESYYRATLSDHKARITCMRWDFCWISCIPELSHLIFITLFMVLLTSFINTMFLMYVCYDWRKLLAVCDFIHRLFPLHETSLFRSEPQRTENVLVTSSCDHSIRLWWKVFYELSCYHRCTH